MYYRLIHRITIGNWSIDRGPASNDEAQITLKELLPNGVSKRLLSIKDHGNFCSPRRWSPTKYPNFQWMFAFNQSEAEYLLSTNFRANNYVQYIPDWIFAFNQFPCKYLFSDQIVVLEIYEVCLEVNLILWLLKDAVNKRNIS